MIVSADSALALGDTSSSAATPSFRRAFLGFLGSTSLVSTAMVLLSSL